MLPTKIYLASSWRNYRYETILEQLQQRGFDVYDFKNPAPGNKGFSWKDTGVYDINNPTTFAKLIPKDPIALEGFRFDKRALDAAEVLILLLPCGKSAHMEFGYASNANKLTYVLLDPNEKPFEPELMYLFARMITTDLVDIVEDIKKVYR